MWGLACLGWEGGLEGGGGGWGTAEGGKGHLSRVGEWFKTRFVGAWRWRILCLFLFHDFWMNYVEHYFDHLPVHKY